MKNIEILLNEMESEIELHEKIFETEEIPVKYRCYILELLVRFRLNINDLKKLNGDTEKRTNESDCVLKRDYETCSFWERNNCECLGCSNYKQTDL